MRYSLIWLIILGLFTKPAAAQTQLDPNFLAQGMYKPTAYLKQAIQLADGSRIFVGGIWRADGINIDHSLVKYLPSGQLDAVFNAQMAQYQFTATVVAEAPGNKLVVGLYGPGTFGTQTHYGVVRLLANGTLDAGFVPQPAASMSYFGTVYLVQADGKILVGNEMARAVSQSARTLARLNADGTPDASFGTSLPAGFTDLSGRLDSPVMAICQQPDGKLIVAHSANGTPGQNVSYRLVRLLPGGAADASFSYLGPLGYQMALALQPDGKLLVATSGLASSGLLTRVLASGAVDFSFQAPTNLVANRADDRNNPAVIQVQPDGRVLVAGVTERAAAQNYATSNSFVVRLLATGARDAGWQPPMYGDYQAYASHIQLLPNGHVLVAGSAKRYASATALPSAVGLLDPSGANVASFAPVLQQGGQVLSIALQTDGRIVAGGEFSEINGTPARNLARFNADGTLDAVFTANAAVQGYVREIQLQRDGKIVLGGQFISAGGQARFAVARLLPSGLCDPAFMPAISPNTVFHVQEANYVAIQPDGQVLASGSLLPAGASTPSRPLARFTATGLLDASFQPGGLGNGNNVYPLLVQPDGKIITAGLDYSNGTGTVAYESVTRLMPNGSLDPSFARIPTLAGKSSAGVWQLEQYPDGRLLVGGNFLNYGSIAANNLVRLLATGTPDATFTSPITSFAVQTTAIQPNGRVLAAGINYGGGSNPPIIRLLNDGSFDASFIRTQGPAYGSWVRKLIVQPNGGILVAGDFYTVAGQTRMGLVRLLDANVLHVASRQTEAATTAWPVPTHGDLHLNLDVTARPQRVQLLDALGRPVLTQTVTQPVLTLATTALPAGTYVLLVTYSTGTVTRRVVVE